MQPAGWRLQPSTDYAVPHHELSHNALIQRFTQVQQRAYLAQANLDNLRLEALSETDGAAWCELAYTEIPAAEELRAEALRADAALRAEIARRQALARQAGRALRARTNTRR